MFNKKLRNNIILITYAVLLISLFLKFDLVISIFYKLIDVLTPFIYGFVIAYIVNWSYVFLLRKFKRLDLTKYKKVKKPLAISLSYLLFLGILVFLIAIIIPQLINSIERLINNTSQYLDSLNILDNDLSRKLPDSDFIVRLSDNITSYLEHMVTSSVEPIFNTTKVITVGVFNWTIGFIISIYFISGKEKLISQLKRTLKAYSSEEIYNKTMNICNMSHHIFGKFIFGKAINAIILGMLCFGGMILFRFDYAILISTIMGISNIIPFFGPIVGGVPSVLILLAVNPMQALWFTVFMIVLQQIDGNLIGPKILGDTVGISGIWIIFSVLIGGGLFGFAGMILGVPVFAIIYIVVSRITHDKIRNKEDMIEIKEYEK